MLALGSAQRTDGAVTAVVVAVVGLLIYLQDCSGVVAISLAPVYWNLTNPIFKTSKNDHIIVVNLFDEIDFVCPYYPPNIADAHLEYYLIYRVSKKEYDECNIYSESASFLILRCTHPTQRRRFTILFEPFQSIPNVPEYKAGHTYYFMTPSTGRKNGWRNLYQGACLQHNMKLTIKVRDGDYEDEEIQQMRTIADSDEVQEEDEVMEYQSQEALKGYPSSSTDGDIRRRHHHHHHRHRFGRSTRRLTPTTGDASTTQTPPANHLHEPEHQELSHSIPEHSDSVVEKEIFEDFLKSENSEPPSIVQTSGASSPSTPLLLTAAAAVAFARWRFGSPTER